MNQEDKKALANKLLFNSKFRAKVMMAAGTRANFYQYPSGIKRSVYLGYDGLYAVDNRDGYEFLEANHG